MTATVRNFAERLAYSHAQSDQPWWEEIYRRAFPDFSAMVDLRPDGWHQRAGRDRVVVLNSGKPLYIDEKAREDDYGDVFVEVWSIYPKNCSGSGYPSRPGAVPGWACKALDCDYLAYAVVPRQVCYLFPYQGIRAAWDKYGGDWRGAAQLRRAGFSWRESPNGTYNTVGICMPVTALWDAIKDALTISWGS